MYDFTDFLNKVGQSIARARKLPKLNRKQEITNDKSIARTFRGWYGRAACGIWACLCDQRSLCTQVQDTWTPREQRGLTWCVAKDTFVEKMLRYKYNPASDICID